MISKTMNSGNLEYHMHLVLSLGVLIRYSFVRVSENTYTYMGTEALLSANKKILVFANKVPVYLTCPFSMRTPHATANCLSVIPQHFYFLLHAPLMLCARGGCAAMLR
jgi:hypothetical protein